MLFAGIITGLAAAVCFSVCYMATRYFVQRRPAGAGGVLWVLSHLAMGIISLALLPWFWPHIQVDWRRSLPPLVINVVTYLLAQMCLMVALNHCQPSKVSPLLGLKLIVLGALASVFYPGSLALLQYVAIGLCIGGALALYHTGGKLRPMAVLSILGACVLYSVSDWNVKRFLNTLPAMHSITWRSVFAMLLSFSLTGIVAMPFLVMPETRKLRNWRGALPFTISWYMAMWFFFACVGFVGPVYANILQSTRGLISILLAAVIARLWESAHHIEAPAARVEFLRRLVAGMLMFLAVVLYALAQPSR